jgi:hypothetical protein
MIALGPREIGKATIFAIAFGGVIHMLTQCVAGYVQCRDLGCLPW